MDNEKKQSDSVMNLIEYIRIILHNYNATPDEWDTFMALRDECMQQYYCSDIRDQFALEAMKVLMDKEYDDLAEQAYLIADDMMQQKMKRMQE